MENDSALKILFVEDLPADNELAMRELKKAGLKFVARRVETKEAFLDALTGFRPDIVISDYSMPRFDGMKALRLSLEHDHQLPFIVLTGSMNEDTAVQCMKAGALDYVIKGHISRLPFAVREAIERSRLSAIREKMDAALRESEQNFRTLADSGQALIWTTDVDKLCTYFNRPWLEFTGRALADELGNGWTVNVHPDDLASCVGTFITSFDLRERFSMEYRMRRKDGEFRWIQDAGSPRYDAAGNFIGYIGHCLDVTERRQAEDDIRKALGEKESLLRELFHRTRNNMQVVMSILAFEDEAAHDELVSKVVRKTSERIMSMALVHQKLYDSKDLSKIDLGEYTKELLEALMEGDAVLCDRISVRMEAEPVQVLIDTAVPIGMVIHELVSNVFRHAYPGGERGEVRIRIVKTCKGIIDLEVSDDGCGLPENFDYDRKDTLGFQLIHGLVEQQLSGVMRFETKRGLSCRISFMDANTMKRI